MSINFAMKDLLHFGGQSKSYLKSSVLIIALAIGFLNFTQSLGLLQISGTINLYTYTIVELFSQFNGFLVSLTYILTIILILSQNHAIILQRKKDIAIMQALGTYPRYVYSFYLTELLILAGISFLLGWIIGFGAFFVFFMIMEGQLANLSWNADWLFTLLLGFLMILFTYIVNGWEIRKIGQLSYAENKSGKINSNVKSQFPLKIREFLNRTSLCVKLAVQNLTRKRSQFHQIIALISIASAVLLTGFIGLFVINSTTQDYLNQGERTNLVVIGSQKLVQNYTRGYSHFSNVSEPTFQEAESIDPNYNLTSFTPILANMLKKYNISSIDSRLFIIKNVDESQGFYLYNNSFVEIPLGNRSRITPIQGIDFENCIQNWSITGALPTSNNEAIVGDTLGVEIFNNPYLQRFKFSSLGVNRTYTFKISGVAIDPFYSGNSIYIPLRILQEKLQTGNYTNLLLFDYSPTLSQNQKSILFSELSLLINATLGSDFIFQDLAPIFQANERSIQSIFTTTLFLSIIMAGVIMYSVYQFQKSRVEEEQKDLFIIKAMGGTSSFLQKSLYYEQAFVFFIGLTIGFAISLFVIIFLLMENAVLPSVLIPIMCYLITLIIFLILAIFSSKMLTKRYFGENLLEFVRA
jgi:ABC-type antimicrobial peptide transport system permease subunit